jgi:hypothetical protein
MEDELRVSLDSVEEGIAVLTTRAGARWLVPVRFLPGDVHEGDVLRVTFSRDAAATEELADRVHELQERLLRRTEDRRSAVE